MQPSVKPSGMILGTSLSECIAMSISLSKSSCWISLTNSPLPPTLDNCLFTMRSPLVTISLISISSVGSTAFNLSINC